MKKLFLLLLFAAPLWAQEDLILDMDATTFNALLSAIPAKLDSAGAATRSYVDDKVSLHALLSHTHSEAQVTGLSVDLASKQDTTDAATRTFVGQVAATKAALSHTHGDKADTTDNATRTYVGQVASGKAALSHTHAEKADTADNATRTYVTDALAGVGGSSWRPDGSYYPWVGKWMSNATNQTATGTQANVNGKIRAFPFYVSKTVVFDSLRCEISTAAAGAFTIAIYNDSTFYGGDKPYPAKLIYCGARDTTSANVKAEANQASPDTLYGPGLFWVAVAANNTSTYRAIPQGSVPSVLGYNPAVGANSQYTCWLVTRTYDQYLPNPFPASGTLLANINPPLIVWRISAVIN